MVLFRWNRINWAQHGVTLYFLCLFFLHPSTGWLVWLKLNSRTKQRQIRPLSPSLSLSVLPHHFITEMLWGKRRLLLGSAIRCNVSLCPLWIHLIIKSQWRRMSHRFDLAVTLPAPSPVTPLDGAIITSHRQLYLLAKYVTHNKSGIPDRRGTRQETQPRIRERHSHSGPSPTWQPMGSISPMDFWRRLILNITHILCHGDGLHVCHLSRLRVTHHELNICWSYKGWCNIAILQQNSATLRQNVSLVSRFEPFK